VSDKINTDIWDDARLIPLLKKGDEEAFKILVRQYRERLFRVAYGITLDREEALEIVQDVFLKVYENIHKFREESKLSVWLRRITVNLSLNWKRRWKRRFRWQHQPLEDDEKGDYPELGTDEYHPGRLYQKKELENLLWKNLKALPEDARTVFILRESEGLSYDEIADALNIKRGTVSSRLFYARQKLKESLKEYADGEEIP